jgi:hypothetical protein
MPVTLALGNLTEKDLKFKTCLGYIVRPWLKKQTKTKAHPNAIILGFYGGFITDT